MYFIYIHVCTLFVYLNYTVFAFFVSTEVARLENKCSQIASLAQRWPIELIVIYWSCCSLAVL